MHEISNVALIARLRELVGVERRTTAEILEYIREVDRRRLYLELGHTSLFAYLTRELGYTPASAQRRIEAARLLRAVPEVVDDLRSGALNLMQVSMVARGMREKPVSVEVKRELLEQLKGKDLAVTEKVLAQALDLPVRVEERARVQKDDSMRLEITLSVRQREALERVKEVISHTHPNASWAELLELMAEEFLKRKDPERGPAAKEQPSVDGKSTSKMEAAMSQVAGGAPSTSKMEVTPSQSSPVRRPIPRPLKRHIFQRDHSCQWRDPRTGRLCGSRFQLQIDHRRPVHLGGGNLPENLQLLCSTHNRWKYEKELASP